MSLKIDVDVTCTRYNIQIGVKFYSVYEYKTEDERFLDYIIRDKQGNKIKEYSEEYIKVGMAFVDFPTED